MGKINTHDKVSKGLVSTIWHEAKHHFRESLQ